MVIVMNDEYFTPKQLGIIILIDLILWMPLFHAVSNIERTRTYVSEAQEYNAIAEEPVIFIERPLEETEAIQEPVPEPVEEVSYSLTDEEIDLLALVTMAEAEGEPEEGKRLVIDTILNRVDHENFPDTVHDVIYQPKAFTSMWTSRVTRCYVRDDIRQLVIEELESRTNDEVIFFRTDYYHSYGTELFQVGNHYFSKY